MQTREEAFADFVQVLIEAAERHDQAAIDALSVSSRTYEGPVGEGVHTHNERIQLHTLVERAKLSAAVLLMWRAVEPVRA